MIRSGGCQIMWDVDKDQVPEESGSSRRRVRRGALRQEAASDRMRGGLYGVESAGGEAAVNTHQDTRPVVKYDRGKDNLDVFTSPFRALAESCGFKVICEDESSDGNSERSQPGNCGAAGGLGSDDQDALDKNGSCTRGRSGLTRTRHGTPVPDVKVEPSISPQTEQESYGSTEKHRLKEVGQDWSKRVDGKTEREAEDDCKQDRSRVRQADRAVSSHGHDFCVAALSHEENNESKTRRKDKNTTRKDKRTNFLHKNSKPQSGESPSHRKDKRGFYTNVEYRKKSKEYRQRENTKPRFASLDSQLLSDSDSPKSAEERSSSDTYQTVQQISSSEETDKRSLSVNTSDSRHTHCSRRCLKDASNQDLNQSSRSTRQEHATVPKPAAQRSQKIFMEMLPPVGVSAETAREEESRAGKRQQPKDQSCNDGCSGGVNSRNKDHKDEYCTNKSRNPVDEYFAEQTNSKTDTHTADKESKEMFKKREGGGGGAAFRISRKLTTASKSSKCGVMRYFRSDTDVNSPRHSNGRFGSRLENTGNCNRNKSAADIGAGDGYEEKNATVMQCKQTLQDKQGPAIHDQVATVKAQSNTPRYKEEFCCHVLEQGHVPDTRGRCIQNRKPDKDTKVDTDKETPELQVLSEISKLRALAAAQERTKSDVGAYSAVDRDSDALPNLTDSKQARRCNQCRQHDLCQQSLNADHKAISHQGCLCDVNHKDSNIRDSCATDGRNEQPSYIHLHSYKDCAQVAGTAAGDETVVDQLETNESHALSDHFPHHGEHKDCGCYCLQGTQHHNAFSCQNSKRFHQCNTQLENTRLCQIRTGQNDQLAPTDGNQEYHLRVEYNSGKTPRQADSSTCPNLQFRGPLPQPSDHPRPDLSSPVCCDVTTSTEDNLTGPRKTAFFAGTPYISPASERGYTAPRASGTPDWRKPHQTLQQQPHHHKDFGFNVNSNYEGSEEGDGVAGSRFIGQYFLKLWKNQCLCDVRLRVGNWSYLAHKIVLAAFSDFFCPNDPHCMPSICFDIPNATPDAVHQILLYLYTSEMEITDYTLESVLCAAESLGVSEVINLVKEILENPTPENFEHYLEIRNRHGFSCHLTDYTELIREHLLDLTSSTHFLELDLGELQQILGDPEVKVDSECDIIDVIARWIEYSPLERIAFSADLLSFVNFDCIPADSLADVVERKRNVFSRDAFSIFLDAFKTRSITAECQPCTPNQTLWNSANATGNYMLNRPTLSATNKSTNADSYRPLQQQQPLPTYDVTDNAATNGMHARGLNTGGSHLQDNFRLQQTTRREMSSRIPRSSQGRITTLLSRPSSAQNQPGRTPTRSTNSWVSDTAHSRPSTGMSTQGREMGGAGGGPRRFATTQNRLSTPREIMSMACKGDYDTSTCHRSGKQPKINRGGGGGGGAAYAFREPTRVPSDPALPAHRARRGSVYRCSNGNAIFSPPSESELGGTPGAVPPLSTWAPPVGNPIWDEGTSHTAPPISPGWSRGSRGSSPAYGFVASPWPSPGQVCEAPPPGCSTFRVVRGGRGPRWEQRSRSPSGGHGSRDRSSTKRVTFM